MAIIERFERKANDWQVTPLAHKHPSQSSHFHRQNATITTTVHSITAANKQA